MVEFIKIVAIGFGLFSSISLAVGVFRIGRFIDGVNWMTGKFVALFLYAICIIFLCGAFGRFDWMQADVDGLSGFRVYWLYATVAAVLPLVGSARVAGFMSVLIIIPCLLVLAYS